MGGFSRAGACRPTRRPGGLTRGGQHHDGWDRGGAVRGDDQRRLEWGGERWRSAGRSYYRHAGYGPEGYGHDGYGGGGRGGFGVGIAPYAYDYEDWSPGDYAGGYYDEGYAAAGGEAGYGDYPPCAGREGYPAAYGGGGSDGGMDRGYGPGGPSPPTAAGGSGKAVGYQWMNAQCPCPGGRIRLGGR
jgi:hypothetical protein